MRVLIVDGDSEMLEAIARRLRDGFSIDVVTSKADALDLLRQNDFHVVVACERLADGSGLDLLSQAAKRWESTIRLFAASADRLALLRGRLGPFKLFQTLAYPINPGELGSILMLAQAAEAANADTTNVQHIVLGDDSATEADAPGAVLVQAAASAAAAAPSLAVARGAARPLPFTVASPAPTKAASAAPSARRAPLTRESLAEVHRSAPVSAPPKAAPPKPVAPRPSTHLPPPRAADVLPALAQLRARLHAMPSGFRPRRKDIVLGAALAAVLVALGITLSLSIDDSSEPPAATVPAAKTQPAAAADPVIVDDTAQRERLADENAARPADAHILGDVPPDAAADLAQPGESAAPPAVDSPSAVAPPSAESSEPPASAAALGEPSAAPTTTEPPTSTFAGRTLESSDAPTAAETVQAPAAAVSAPPEPLEPRKAIASPPDIPPVVREAKLVRNASPDYPSDAAASGTEGSVDVAFTISASGRVTDAVVVEGAPPGVFDRAALSAVKRWRYEPRIEDGVPVDWRTQVHIEFRLAE